RVQALDIGGLMDEAALAQHIEKIRLKCAHVSVTLIIRFLRYLQAKRGTRDKGCRKAARCGIIRCVRLAQA
ncbi:MAG TPA: hypothetical protein VGH70_08355, partial [Bradyrhizobium sp.]